MKPIVRGRTILVEQSKLWTPLKYEKLLRICFNSEQFIHGSKGCSKGKSKDGKVIEQIDQFGSWLRVETHSKYISISRTSVKGKADISKSTEE